MYDLFICASGYQNIEIKEDQRCLSPDVCHSHDRIVPLAGLWVYPEGFPIDFGQYYKLHTLSLCVTSQDKAWIKMTPGATEFSELLLEDSCFKQLIRKHTVKLY